MAVEVPEYKSNCFCFPLLPDCLFACGCFKIIAYLFIIPIAGYFLLFAYLMLCFGVGHDIFLLWILYPFMTPILFIILIMDFIVTIVFACFGDEENLKLLRIYYRYNIGVLIVMTLLTVAASVIVLATWSYSGTIACLALFVIAVMEAYFILLLRSQVIKLESSSECRRIRE